jgi:hypothetical protein
MSTADGRVYTIRVCAADVAGLQTCAERAIGVESRWGRAPVSQGKLFIVAHDAQASGTG